MPFPLIRMSCMGFDDRIGDGGDLAEISKCSDDIAGMFEVGCECEDLLAAGLL